jgi:hypothetical protein
MRGDKVAEYSWCGLIDVRNRPTHGMRIEIDVDINSSDSQQGFNKNEYE